MILPIPAKLYVVMFLVAILLLPLVIFFPVLIFERLTGLYWALLVGNAILLAVTWHYNSGPRLSFFTGLEIITRTFMSGCANLTMLYLYPALVMAYSLAVANAMRGLRLGRSYTQEQWLLVVREYEIVRGRR
jgi:hypothetical protein